MADYGIQSSRPPRQNPYGNAPSYQRDGSSSFQREAAFSNIFGAAPPPGRSQTMPTQPEHAPPERAHTMTSQSGMGSQPPPTLNQRPPQMRMAQSYGQTMGGPASSEAASYGSAMTNGYHPNHDPVGNMGQRRDYGQPLAPGPRQPDAAPYQHPAQHFPPASNPERRPFPQHLRGELRQQPYQQYNRHVPGRGQPVPPQAMNSDSYRSRSMANISSPGSGYQSRPMPYNPSPATAFREQQYHPPVSRTTAQGRIVPERQDERAMSMTSWSSERDHSQTMSGRVIPNRRKETGLEMTQEALPPSAPSSSAEANPSSPVHLNGRSVSAGSIPSRSMSMASTALSDRSDSFQHRPSSKTNVSSSSTVVSNSSRSPLVYPAMLSRVSLTFMERIDARERAKNELTYKLAFTGKEAVDLIAYIIKTTDRNLALLLGRALDAQRFFHDVTYEHRLRDSPLELYQFQEVAVEETPTTNVNGVFTLLTECYSPTCARDRLCYSIACPNRLEQQSRLNLKPQPGLRRQTSSASLKGDDNDEQKLWINTVSKEVADSVDEREKKRQEVISEIMYTERDFVKDLEYLRDFWMNPLRSNKPNAPLCIPEHRREKFVRVVFSNLTEVHSVNSRLAEALTRRQQENPVVKEVADIFLQFIPRFEPFITYGAHQLFGKFEFEREKASNPAFSKFVDETERLKESRKLELNGYLTKPTTRLARYPLLLETVLKYTADDDPDKKAIPLAVSQIKALLSKVNVESGKAENAFNLLQLNNALKWPPNEYMDLKLTEEGRQMIYKGSLRKSPTDTSEVMVYLFDHAVLLAKQKIQNKREEIKVYKRPIPLELLVILQMDEVIPKLGIKRPSSALALTARTALNTPKTSQAAKEGFPITFKHLGKHQYEQTLYAPNQVARKKWMEHIEGQQSKLLNRVNVYKKTILCDDFFTSLNRVNCLVPVDGGRKLVYGTDIGIYVSDRRPKATDIKPRKVIDTTFVTQVDVLEEYQLLLVLTNKTLVSYPLEVLDPAENQSPLVRRPKKIQGHANFFQTGVCVGKHLVCAANNRGLSTTIKVFEPTDTVSKNKKKPAITQLFQSSSETLKPFKEFYIPTESTSIHFLKTKLCVACARGFEIVSLETLENQSLLDQADTSLDFVARERDSKPIHIERLNGEFLLNYSESSFFVNRNGWRSRPDWRIIWEGNPSAFAMAHPYILAFEPNFIEIRHADTSACVHILTARNIRMLHSSTREVIYAYEEDSGEDVVACLDFWGSHA